MDNIQLYYRLTCRFCGHEAEYDDISDGDFDTENGECFSCSEENRELREKEEIYTRYSGDGRRWACSKKVQHSNDIDTILEKRYSNNTVPEWMDENVQAGWKARWDRKLSEHTWLETLKSGLPVNLSTSAGRDEHISENMQRVFREIDVRGPAIMEEKLGRWKSRMNMRSEMGVGLGLVKGAITTSPIMHGGGGGGGREEKHTEVLPLLW